MSKLTENNLHLDVQDLTIRFRTRQGEAEAVRGLSFQLQQGEILGFVGESGSGKSVTCKSIIGLLPDNVSVSGQILFHGKNLLSCTEKEMEKYRGRHISMVFQEPMESLDPSFRIEQLLHEVIMAHDPCSREESRERSLDMLKKVDIADPVNCLKRYPFELSGGMQQRIMIAMALLCKPEILLADEPTTALDVIIQEQILDLLRRLNDELGTSIILITHDMGVIAETVDRVAVMYCGQIVEMAEVRDLISHPMHPYTQGLLSSLQERQSGKKELVTIPGTVPSIFNIPSGCSFHNRCPFTRPICAAEVPQMLNTEGRQVLCWRYHERYNND